MVDATDSKSVEGNLVWVRVPPPVLFQSLARRSSSSCRQVRRYRSGAPTGRMMGKSSSLVSLFKEQLENESQRIADDRNLTKEVTA